MSEWNASSQEILEGVGLEQHMNTLPVLFERVVAVGRVETDLAKSGEKIWPVPRTKRTAGLRRRAGWEESGVLCQ